MVSSIGSIASSIFQYTQTVQSSSDAYSTKQVQSFDELVGNGVISLNSEESGTGITALGGSSSSSQKSEMDLNQDGQVTIDEVIRYTQMQMQEQMKEIVASDVGSEEMSQNENQNARQDKIDLSEFKSKMATQAYQLGETLLNTSIGAITNSFVL